MSEGPTNESLPVQLARLEGRVSGIEATLRRHEEEAERANGALWKQIEEQRSMMAAHFTEAAAGMERLKANTQAIADIKVGVDWLKSKAWWAAGVVVVLLLVVQIFGDAIAASIFGKHGP